MKSRLVRRSVRTSKASTSAVRWRVLNETVEDVRRHNAKVPPEEIDAAVLEALAAMRAQR